MFLYICTRLFIGEDIAFGAGRNRLGDVMLVSEFVSESEFWSFSNVFDDVSIVRFICFQECWELALRADTYVRFEFERSSYPIDNDNLSVQNMCYVSTCHSCHNGWRGNLF